MTKTTDCRLSATESEPETDIGSWNWRSDSENSVKWCARVCRKRHLALVTSAEHCECAGCVCNACASCCFTDDCICIFSAQNLHTGAWHSCKNLLGVWAPSLCLPAHHRVLQSTSRKGLRTLLNMQTQFIANLSIN